MACNFIHISDTHLGFSDLDIQDSSGKNIREEDVYKAFSDAVDFILKDKPDFVLHTGDIFHRSSPTNRALVEASKQIMRINSAGIPFYMIAGNHDFPKSVFTSPIHDLYRINDLTKIAYSEKLEVLETPVCILHLLPHINSEEKFREEIDKIIIKDKNIPNILAMHLAVSSYVMNEFGERVFPLEKADILKEFDYVALGHWHKFNHLKKYGNVFYSGSTERTSDSQTGYEKGFVKVVIDIETKTEFIPLKLRTYEKIKIEKCFEKSTEEIVNEIKEKVSSFKIEDGIFHLQLIEIAETKVNDLPRTLFEDIFEGALFFNVSKTIRGSDKVIEIDSESFDLKEYFFDELKTDFEGDDLKKVTDLSRKLWEEIEEEEANADS